MVDVSGIDRVELLRALWENSSPAVFFAHSGMSPSVFDEREAREHRGEYVDYFCGRCIKSNVFTKENVIDPGLYDRDFGQGAFQKVVDRLRRFEQKT
jgi:hypothetical protein